MESSGGERPWETSRQITRRLVTDGLTQALLQNYHLDHGNAAVHTAKVRYSPLTFRLAEALEQVVKDFGPPGVVCPEAQQVLADRGSYPEDPGRE